MKLSPNQPRTCCYDCGVRFGSRKPIDFSTYHAAFCPVCGKNKAVTEPRDFGYLKPDWEAYARKYS